MNRLTKTIIVFTTFICYTLSTKVIFDCYINKGTQNEIKIGFSHHNYVFANSNNRTRDINVDKIIGIHHQINNEGSTEHVSLAQVFFYGSGMNILHFSENGETKVYYLGNYVSRKFRAFVMSVKLLDPTEKYSKPADVPIEDLMNKSLYWNSELPEFTFEMDKTSYMVQCEILPPQQDVVLSQVSEHMATNTVNVKPNGISVSGVHNPDNQKFII